MSSRQIKEIKILFKETGRLNRKVIRDEIALSWYRCRLNHIESLKMIDHHKHKAADFPEETMLKIKRTLAILNKKTSDVFLIDSEGHIIESSSDDVMLNALTSFAESEAGTNAGSQCLKSGHYESVIYGEHYIDALEIYCSYAYPIKNDDVHLYTVVVFSKVKLNEYDRQHHQEEVDKLKDGVWENNREENSVEERMTHLSHYMMMSPEEANQLEAQIRRKISIGYPIFIYGPKGSGKSNLAWYIAEKIGKAYQYIDLEKVPPVRRKVWVQEQLCHYETIILDSLFILDSEGQQLLTNYVEEKIINQNKDKYSDFKCLNIILTSVYRPRDLMEEYRFSERFISRICQQTINISECCDQSIHENDIERLLTRYNYKFSDGYKRMLEKVTMDRTIDEAVSIIEKSLLKAHKDDILTAEDIALDGDIHYESLAEMEKKYILEVYRRLEENMTLTAEILEIGRSTLYRKLKSYHIDTEPKKQS